MRMDAPCESNVNELEQREAAHLRAQTKLADARSEQEKKRQTYPWTTKALPRFKSAGVMALVLAMPVAVAYAAPESVSPHNWIADPRFAFVLSISLFMAAVSLVVIVRRRRMDDIERTIHDFYETVSDCQGQAHDLMQFVVQSDFDGFARRDCPIPTRRPLPIPADRNALDRYWNLIVKGTSGRITSFDVDEIKQSEIAPDLRLVFVKLRLIRVPRLIIWLIVAFIVIPSALHQEMTSYGLWWHYIVALFVICVGFRLGQRHYGTNEVYRVRKVLVKCGGRWRFFCGDWEGWEERDLGWLDPKLLK